MGIDAETIKYLEGTDIFPFFLNGDSLHVLQNLPEESIDCCITSPPYWNQRQYEKGGIGLEKSVEAYVSNLLQVIEQIKRVLKPTGAFWLNIGDSYMGKSLQGIPWQIALKMIQKGWILRNTVIWNKQKGGLCPINDRFGCVSEEIFFFVKKKNYYFNADAIRSKPRLSKIKNGIVTTSTGVTGVSYRRKIELSTSLSETEKNNALKALENILMKIKTGELTDFRMVIRNEQRTTHSDSIKVSGRAKELQEKGFYFLFYNPKGCLPNNIWEIIPEDSQKREIHFAPYPEELCIIPIRATCPSKGVVLDPFCGTGTTMKVAYDLSRKSIGIDISEKYVHLARERICKSMQN